MGPVIEALLFDFDGLLVDTETPEHRAWQEAFRDHGVELTLEHWSQGIGTLDGFEPAAHLEELLGRQVDRAVVVEKTRRREAEFRAGAGLRPGVEGYLAEARRLGLSVAIVSSSSRRWIDENLALVGRSDEWSCVVCADGDASRAKPRPTLYVEALDTLGVSPESAIAFEDSPNGIDAARAARIFCVAVPNAVTARLDLSRADLVVDSLDDLPLVELLTRVG
jgi:HAD superfamily hydrolase (TIGR01509 family)